MDVFSRILTIPVNDGVGQGFPQCDFDVAHAFRNPSAIPEKSTSLSTKGEITVTSLGKEHSAAM